MLSLFGSQNRRCLFILNFDGARAAADASSMRWRDNKPLSAIDGMPIGLKDIIETAEKWAHRCPTAGAQSATLRP
jgi:Asp-tRNA(Asn)/Glu-tRNA(Gln) amidotransferase A subunit family amidase